MLGYQKILEEMCSKQKLHCPSSDYNVTKTESKQPKARSKETFHSEMLNHSSK